MKFTKKRRVGKTTKRMTLSRRGKKHGGEFKLLEQLKKTCMTSYESCTINKLISLSKLLKERKTAVNKNALEFNMKKQKIIFDQVNQNMKNVKTIKELGNILKVIRDDTDLFVYFNDPKNKPSFINSVNVPGINPNILEHTFKNIQTTIFQRQKRAKEIEFKRKFADFDRRNRLKQEHDSDF